MRDAAKIRLFLICSFGFAFLLLSNADGISPATIPLRVYHPKPNGKTKAPFRHSILTTAIRIGNPEKEFTVAVETGPMNWELFVFDSEYSAPRCPNQNFYNFSNSASGSRLDDDFATHVGRSRIYGIRYSDLVEIGGHSLRMEFGGALEAADFVDEPFPVDGVLGYSANPMELEGEEGAPPLLQMLNGKPAIFSVAGSSGIVTNGQPGAHCSQAHYVPAKDQRWFGHITADSLNLNGVVHSTPLAAIPDTGYSNIGLPKAVFAKIQNLLELEFDETLKLYTIGCSRLNNAESWGFTFGGVEFFVKSKHLLVDLNLDGNRCVWAMEPAANIVLGVPFHLSVCVVYDLENRRVGCQQNE